MNKGLNKTFGILLIAGMILSSMTLITTNVGCGEDEEEIEIENLNPDAWEYTLLPIGIESKPIRTYVGGVSGEVII